ncbi:DUF192 domain-containing protein [Phaeovulum sp. W22_SRMD_FR3]|uniref:DUF192 domain-containing protein n=1 Tax=Phaeovulum sp. W22_SRMD_FR3 TaxID=3240274 RepID=UPI003F9778E6
MKQRAGMMRRILMRATVALSLLGAATMVPGQARADVQCQSDQAVFATAAGGARFTIEIADTEAERAQGLMNRPAMPRSAGMLFIYPKPQPVAFWMKNTLIPLDMIFMDAGGTVVSVAARARPHDETPIPGGEAIQYVLEINGGLAQALGIVPGVSMAHPRIAPAHAALPCSRP